MNLRTNISVKYSSDKMKAYVLVPFQAAEATVQDVIADLQALGIVHGVSKAVIEKVFSGKHFDKYVEVARGTPVNPGVPGKIEILLDTSGVGKPKELKDGTVDHKVLSYFINVKSGTALARRIPPQFGLDGTTVFGKTVKAPPVKDIALNGGTGTQYSPDDANLLVAQYDGVFILHNSGLVEVHQSKEIPGDIDYSTGNITFTGDLLIGGTVRAGFKVEVSGSLKIMGCLEDAFVKCGGDLLIRSGVVGSGKGEIQCGGAMQARHLENVRVSVGQDLQVNEDILHCNIDCKGKVVARSVVGGNVSAFLGIQLERAGSVGEVRTVLDVGARYTWLRQQSVLSEKLKEQCVLLDAVKYEAYCFVRDQMGSDGVIAQERKNELDVILKKALECNDMCRVTSARLNEVELFLKKNSDPKITAREICPNVLVRMGSVERLIKETVRNAVLRPTEFR